MAKIKITNQAEPSDGVASGTSEIYVDSTSKVLSVKDDADVVTAYSNDHTDLTNIGSNTHAQIDTAVSNSTSHIADTANPHSVDIDDVTPTTTKGDIIVEDGSNAIRVAIGTDDQVLTADSAEASGVKWADATGGGGGGSTIYGIENPVDTNWKVRRNEFTTGDGNNFWGELPMRGLASTGAVVAETALGSGEEHRVGIITVGGGTTYGMLIGYESDTRFGDADHRFGCGLKLVNIPDATDDANFAFGYSMDTNSIGTYMSYIGIDRTVNATNFIAVSRRAGTQTATDTGVAFAAGTWHTFEVVVNVDNTSHTYYIDGVLVATHTTNLPNSSLCPTVAIFNVAGAARSLEIDWMYQAFKPATVRGVIKDWITNTPPPQYVNPVDTSWKYWNNDFGGFQPLNAGAYYFGDGTLGLSPFKSGTGSTWTVLATPEADRMGVHDIGIGTSAGALVGPETSQSDSTYRWGDGRIKVGAAIKLVDKPTATEDYDFFMGLGNNISTFSSNGGAFYIDPGTSTANWLVRSDNTSVKNTDTGIAFDNNWVNLEIDVAGDLSSVAYYIDGVLAYTETDAAYIPDAGDKFSFNVTGRVSSVTQVNHYYIDWMYMAIKPNNARGAITTFITDL